MKHVIFEHVKWPHNSGTIYAAINDPKQRPKEPTVISLTDGFSIVCIPHTDHTLAPLTISVGPGYVYEVQDAFPALANTTSGISENTLLKAIAITKDA